MANLANLGATRKTHGAATQAMTVVGAVTMEAAETSFDLVKRDT